MSIPMQAARVTATGEIDLELLTFVERYATNLARWDLLLYFGRNPTACDNAPSIAGRVGRRAQVIEKELEDLVYLGVLHAHENGSGPTYQLVGAPMMRRAVIRLAERYDAPALEGT